MLKEDLFAAKKSKFSSKKITQFRLRVQREILDLSNGEYRYFTDNDTVCCRSGDTQTERHSQCTNDRMTVSLEIRNDKNQDLT